MPRKSDIATNICPSCKKRIHDNQKGIKCGHCLLWYQADCCCFNNDQYSSLSYSQEAWFCVQYMCDALPYYNLSNEPFDNVLNLDNCLGRPAIYAKFSD